MFHATICHQNSVPSHPTQAAFATRFLAELTRILAQMGERR